MRVQVDECAAKILLDDFFDSRIPDCSEPAIGQPSICIWQNRIADPWIRVVNHRIRQSPHHVTPCKQSPKAGPDTAKIFRADDIQRLYMQSGEKIEFSRQS